MRARDVESKEASVAKLAIDLGAPFRDDAVLQREMELPVWGWSKPETKVTAEFSGKKKSATAGKAKDLVTDGPMYKSYKVEGDKVVLELEHA